MNKKFLRDDFEYYLEIEDEEGEDYEYQMLLVNQIGTILPVNIITVNEKRQLIYSASGYKTLESCLEKMVINSEQILRVVECILDGVDEVRRYLLAPNNLVLAPDCLFVEPDYSRTGLIYVPGYGRDIILQLKELMEVLLGRIDSSDMPSVMLAWKLHTLLKEEHISLREIRKTMSGYKEREKENTVLSVETEEERYICFRLSQLSKAAYSISIIDFGIMIDSIAWQLAKAALPILFTLPSFGMTLLLQPKRIL